MKEPRIIHVCQACGAQTRKWFGQCPDCGAWNSLVEEAAPAVRGGATGPAPAAGGATAQRYDQIETADAARQASGIGELDRVLGGGIVPGSAVLLGGEPGIGKSTLLLQMAAAVARTLGPVLYASGEESVQQLKMRGDRLGLGAPPLYLLAETCLERIVEEAERVKPVVLIVDSIQTVFSLKLQSAPGSIGQVRAAAADLLFIAKGRNLATFLVGHVTKGTAASPGRRCWSMSSIRCCTSKGSGIIPTG